MHKCGCHINLGLYCFLKNVYQIRVWLMICLLQSYLIVKKLSSFFKKLLFIFLQVRWNRIFLFFFKESHSFILVLRLFLAAFTWRLTINLTLIFHFVIASSSKMIGYLCIELVIIYLFFNNNCNRITLEDKLLEQFYW